MTRTLRRDAPVVTAPENSYSGAAHRRNLVLLWAGQFVNTAGLMMLVPIMPFYLQGMGTASVAATQTWAGVAIAAPALALTVATPFWGRVGDRIGRKWMVVRALLGLAVAMGVMATATTPLLLVAGRLLQGTLGGVVEAAAAFAGSVGSGAKRGSSLGKSFSATAAGALAGPIAGGMFVGNGGLRPLMLVIAAAAVLLAAACALGLREPAREPTGSDTVTRSSRRSRRRPSVMTVPGAVPLALAAIGAYFGVYGLIPVFAAQVSTTVPNQSSASVWVGVLYSVMWAATLLGSFYWGKHNDASKRPLRTFALAAAACAASIAPLALPIDPTLLIPLRLVQGFAFAALAQSLFLHFGNHAPERHRSGFVSSANSFLLIGQAAGPLLAGPLIGLMPVALTVVAMAATCGIGSVLAAAPARAEKHAANPDTDEEKDDTELAREDLSEEDAEERTAPLSQVAGGSHRNGIDVLSFRGWHLAEHRVSDLAAHYATPWEQNVAQNAASPGETASTLRAWQRSGTLVRDEHPALYAYQQTGPHGRQLGLVAAVHLDSGVLPHEEVVPERAEDLAQLCQAGEMNLDPLLLGYSGEGRTAQHLARVARRPPASEVDTVDGQRHRIWRVADRAVRDEITDELGTRAAFLADGHHRYTAARQLRRERYADGYGSGPWDWVAGLLVDVQCSTMRLDPVHRVLPFAEPRPALSAAADHFHILPLHGGLEHWLRTLKAHATGGPAFVVVTPRAAFLLVEPDPAMLAASVQHLPASLRHLHVAVLHASLIETAWQTPCPSPQVHYEPSARAAVRHVRAYGGLAVLLNPPTHTDLTTAAIAGVRLPHKATSFGPKPHPGLVIRTFDEE